VAIRAQLDITPKQSRRGFARRQMTLRTQAITAAGNTSNALICNLSTTGLLLESQAGLAAGDELVVELPEAGHRRAKVVWASDNLFGCAFESPLTKGAVSAAQLLGESPRGTPDPKSRERGGSDPTLSFGSQVRKLRQDRGLSLVEFAKRMGVSRPTVWAWESEKSRPRASKMARLLDVLEVSQLYGGAISAPADDEKAGASLTPGKLASAIADSKKHLAEVAGTVPEKIKVIVEF